MGKYLITGVAGSGKSSVIDELRNRGFAAYDTDDLPDVTRLQDKETGEWYVMEINAAPQFDGPEFDQVVDAIAKIL